MIIHIWERKHKRFSYEVNEEQQISRKEIENDERAWKYEKLKKLLKKVKKKFSLCFSSRFLLLQKESLFIFNRLYCSNVHKMVWGHVVLLSRSSFSVHFIFSHWKHRQVKKELRKYSVNLFIILIKMCNNDTDIKLAHNSQERPKNILLYLTKAILPIFIFFSKAAVAAFCQMKLLSLTFPFFFFSSSFQMCTRSEKCQEYEILS